MSVEVILLGVLSTWCLSCLLYYWSGLEWLRDRAGVYFVDDDGDSITFAGRQLQCFWCVAVWVGIPVVVLAYLAPAALYYPAFVGGTILLAKGGRIIWRSMTNGES